MKALEVLNEARAVGVDVAVDGGDLVLAATCQPPQHVIEALSSHKAEIIALLQQVDTGWSPEDWKAYFDERAGIAEFDGGQSCRQAEATAFECCVVEFMNRNRGPSDPAFCAWCGKQGDAGHVIVPFGIQGSHHTWLHPECWIDWHQARRAQAKKALEALGIKSRRES